MWEGDIRDGQGVMTYKDGSTYSGSWKADVRAGQGKMKYYFSNLMIVLSEAKRDDLC